MFDPGLPQVGEVVEISSMEQPHAKAARFEVISVDPRSGLIEARACEANADGEHTHVRMRLQRLQ